MAKKEREYSEQAKAFFLALGDKTNKGNIKECMKIAGYADSITPYQIIRQFPEEIAEIANKLIAAHSVQAVVSLIGVLDNPSSLDAKSIIQAANSLLDRSGLVKKESQDVNIKVPGNGLLILPAKNKNPLIEEEEGTEDGSTDS